MPKVMLQVEGCDEVDRSRAKDVESFRRGLNVMAERIQMERRNGMIKMCREIRSKKPENIRKKKNPPITC